MAVALVGLQRDQSLIAIASDPDNSLSMRRVKLGSMGTMIHVAEVGGGLHSVTNSCQPTHQGIEGYSA